jgi:hypothetical protein
VLDTEPMQVGVYTKHAWTAPCKAMGLVGSAAACANDVGVGP